MPTPANLIHQTSTSTGTGNLTLSAVNGKQSFATAFSTGVTTNVFDYFISNQGASEWERGTGHMSDATTLVRDTVKESTNSNAAVNFSAGTKDITNDIPAAKQVYVLPNYITGLTLANNGTDATNDIDIATGWAADSTNADMMRLSSALTKRLDAAWAVGSGNGGLDTGSIANTTYHVWLIKRSDTEVVDALFSTSASAPTMPTNYDLKRRIGSIVRASAAIRAFVQVGDRFRWQAGSIRDVTATNPGTSAVLATLSVPVGIIVEADISALIAALTNAAIYVLVTSPSETDRAPSGAGDFTIGTSAAAAGGQVGLPVAGVRTDTSAQIRYRMSVSGASDTFVVNTFGWIDPRGQ